MRILWRKRLAVYGAIAVMLFCINGVNAAQYTPTPSPTKPVVINLLSAPSILQAISEAPGAITLTWVDNSTGETSFMIERRMENTEYANVAFAARNATSFTDSESGMHPIYPGEKYWYRVKAINDSGESAYSNEACATVKKYGAPTPPTMLIAEVVVSTMGHPVKLTWHDNANDETKFVVQRQKAGQGYVIVTELAPNTTEYTDSSNLQEDIEYTYRIEVFNAYGSAYSNYSSIVKPSSAPSAPQGFNGIAQGSTSIKLTWIDTSDNEEEFWIVKKRNDGTYNYTPDYILGPNVTEFIDSGLQPETVYNYIIISRNALYSSFITETKATTGPPAPVNPTAIALDSSKIKLTWEINSLCALGYRIERKNDNGDFEQITYLINPESFEYTDNALSPEKEYTYRIQAWNVFSPSDYSAEVSAVTKPLSFQPVNQFSQIQTVIKLNLDSQSYYVNDQVFQTDTAPISREGRTMLPIGCITEALGAQISWIDEEKKVTISLRNRMIELWIGKNTALVNGQEVRIDPANSQVMPVIMPPGRAMLPVSFISENLGCRVDWNPVAREVKITANNVN